MKKPNETKKRIIAAATHLFRRRGYHGTGLAEILKESGAPKGSFYFHFPAGKEQLVAVAIEAAADDTEKLLQSAVKGATGLSDFLDKLIGSYCLLLERSKFEASSLMTNTALDVSPENQAITQHIRSGFRRWHKLIAAYCTSELGSREKGADMAVLIIASLEGALPLCRVEQSTAPLKAVQRRLRDEFSDVHE